MKTFNKIGINIIIPLFLLPYFSFGNILKFDFGGDGAHVWNNFSLVTPDTRFQNGGYGWVGDAKVTAGDCAIIDDLCRDYNQPVSEKTFRIKLDKGKYKVWVIMGNMMVRPGIVEVNMHFLRGIKANGTEAVKPLLNEIDYETYKDYAFAQRMDADYHKGDTVWSKCIEPRFEEYTFEAAVNGEYLDITFNRHVPVCGMIVWDIREDKNIIKELNKLKGERRKRFEKNLTEKRCVPYETDVLSIPERDPATESAPLAGISPKDKARGYILFNRYYMDPVYPYTIPKEEEIGLELKTFTAQGQTGIVALGVYPLKNLKGVEITVSDLKTEGGAGISKEKIKAHIVRYKIRRHSRLKLPVVWAVERCLVRPAVTMDMEKGVAREYFIEIRTPADAKPGNYTGEIAFKPANRKGINVRLKLKVLPFQLITTDDTEIFAHQYNNTIGYNLERTVNKPADYQKILYKTWKLYNDCNLGPPIVCDSASDLTLKVENKGEPDQKVLLDFEKLHTKMAIRKKIGFPQKRILIITSSVNGHGVWERLPIVMQKERYFAAATQPDSFWQAYKSIILRIAEELGKAGYSPKQLIWMPSGEINNGGQEFIKYMFDVYKMFRQIMPDSKIAWTGYSMDEAEMFAPFVDIMGLNAAGPINMKNIEALKKINPGIDFWTYQQQNRFYYGFFRMRIGATGSWSEMFVYPRADDYNDFDTKHDDEYMAYLKISPYGPVILLLTIFCREGMYDAKYVGTLREYIKKARASNNPDALKVAEEGEEMLKRIMKNIQPDDTYYRFQNGWWNLKVYDLLRTQLAKSIIKISKALKK